MDAQMVRQPIVNNEILDLSPQELGARGERVAASYLERRGWQIAERNWKCPFGEADIIAYDDRECVFVEVKTRLVQDIQTGVYPELAVDEEKRGRYIRMAQYYMANKGIEKVRFDVIALQVNPSAIAHLHHRMDAFGCDD